MWKKYTMISVAPCKAQNARFGSRSARAIRGTCAAFGIWHNAAEISGDWVSQFTQLCWPVLAGLLVGFLAEGGNPGVDQEPGVAPGYCGDDHQRAKERRAAADDG